MLVSDINTIYNITFGDNEPIVTAITKTYYNNSDLEIIRSLNDLVMLTDDGFSVSHFLFVCVLRE